MAILMFSVPAAQQTENVVNCISTTFDLCDIDNHHGKGVYMYIYIYIYAALMECSAVVQLG